MRLPAPKQEGLARDFPLRWALSAAAILEIKSRHRSYSARRMARVVWICSCFLLFVPVGQRFKAMVVAPVISGKLLQPTTLFQSRIHLCKVTRRRHRVSPCRSAYFACPWWLLAFDLRRRSREAALLFLESWWHLTMRLPPVFFLW